MKMTKGERLTAEIPGEIPPYGCPVLTEAHPFLRKVIAFMQSGDEWNGAVTELLVAVRDSYTPPGTAAKLLRKYEDKLFHANGITVCFSRTCRKRIITLRTNKRRE